MYFVRDATGTLQITRHQYVLVLATHTTQLVVQCLDRLDSQRSISTRDSPDPESPVDREHRLREHGTLHELEHANARLTPLLTELINRAVPDISGSYSRQITHSPLC